MMHAALAYAESAQYAKHADVKIVMTPMLLAEIERSHEIYSRHNTSNKAGPSHNGQMNNRIKYARGESKKGNNNPRGSLAEDYIPLHEMLDAYRDYVEFAPPSSIEMRFQEAMTQHLATILSHNMHKFYDIIDTPISILKPEQELPALMSKDPLFFSKTFTACMKLPNFREKMTRLGLHKNQADKSIIAWYEGHKHLAPDTEILLASTDKEVIDGMKEVNQNVAPSTPADQRDHLYHFDQRGAAKHLATELDKMTLPTKEEDYSSHITIKSSRQMCRKLSISVGAHNIGDYGNGTSSRLK